MKEELQRIFSTLKNQIQNKGVDVEYYQGLVSIAENEANILLDDKC